MVLGGISWNHLSGQLSGSIWQNSEPTGPSPHNPTPGHINTVEIPTKYPVVYCGVFMVGSWRQAGVFH